MAYGFEVLNSSGHTVIDSTYSCLHTTGTSTSNYTSSQSWATGSTTQTPFVTVYIHTISCQKDDFIFVNITGSNWCSGGFFSSGVKTFYSSMASFSYFKAQKPSTATGYGLATYDASGNLLYSANQDLVSIKDVEHFTQTNTTFTKSTGVNYYCPTPCRFYINFGNIYGIVHVCLQGTATSQMTYFSPRNPVFVFPPNIFGSTGIPDMYILTAKYG